MRWAIEICIGVLIALAGAASASGTNPPPSPAQLVGRVLGEDGQAVAGAVVRLLVEPQDSNGADGAGSGGEAPSAVRLVSGPDGTFRATNLAGSSFRLRVEAPGSAPFNQRQIPAGASVRVRLEPGHTLWGVVRDPSTRKPIPGASVVVCDLDSTPFGEEACRRGESDPNGAFAVHGLPRGTVRVAVRAQGKSAARLPPIVVPRPNPEGREPAGLEVYLLPGVTLGGRVVDPDGKPVEGADVGALSLETSPRQMRRDGPSTVTRTDASGGFTFEGLPPGRYRLRSRQEGLVGVEVGPVELQAGKDRLDVEIRLAKGATLKVRVVDPEEKPLRGLSVELLEWAQEGRGPLRGNPREISREQVEEGEDGNHTVKGLPTGAFLLRLLLDEGSEVTREDVRLEDGTTLDLGTILVEPGRRISGRITDGAGAAVAQAEITVRWEASDGFRTRSVYSRGDGRYRVGGLGEDPIEVVSVRAKGFARSEREAILPGDETVDFVLARNGRVTGRVRAPENEPLSVFRVRLYPEAPATEDRPRTRTGGALLERVFADPAGRFDLDEVECGTYTVEAAAQSYAPARKPGVRVDGEEVVDAGTLSLEPGITIRGRVLDAKSEVPVAGATVRVERPSGLFPLRAEPSNAEGTATTEFAGTFTVTGLLAGAHAVVVEHPDFSPSNVRIETHHGESPPELVVRLSSGGRLTGTVRDANGSPVFGARIVLANETRGESIAASTGSDGRYAFERLAPGAYRARRAPEGGMVLARAGLKRVEIREGETSVLDFDEAPKILWTGRVLRGDEPVGGVTLLLALEDTSSGLGDVQAAYAENTGEFRVGLDRAGTYRVSVQAGRRGFVFTPSSARVSVPDLSEFRQDIILQSGAVTGRVVEVDGRAIANAVVVVTPDPSSLQSSSSAGSARTGSDGAFAVEGLRTGTYRVTVRAAGFRIGELQAITVDGSDPNPTIEIRLERGRVLRGRVVDPRSVPIPGALVFVSPSAAPASTLTTPVETDLNGRFETAAPADGPVDLAAIAPGWSPARLQGVEPPPEQDGEGVVLRATIGGRLRIRTLTREGIPAVGTSVALRSLSGSPGIDFALIARRPAPTGPDGSTIAELLSPGPYEVFVPDRREVPAVRATVVEGQEASIEIVLP